MPQKCTQCSGKKNEAISSDIRLCVTHYVERYVNPQRQALPVNQRFSQLGTKQAEVGRLLGEQLQGTNAPLQATLYQEQNAELFWYAQGLDKLAAANEFGTCVAFCAWGAQLIMATNDSSTLAQQIRMEKLNKIATAVVQSDDLTTPTAFIFLSQAAPEQYHRNNGVSLQAAVGGGLGFVCDTRKEVHAEMRILEYLHQANTGNARADVYIAISKPCCVKCEAIMAAYNAWNAGVVTVYRQGSLTGLFGQWKVPAALKPLTQTIPYWRALKNSNM